MKTWVLPQIQELAIQNIEGGYWYIYDCWSCYSTVKITKDRGDSFPCSCGGKFLFRSKYYDPTLIIS